MAAVLALAGPAAADPLTVTATVGPVAVPGVPVNVCVDDGTTTCTPTPATTTVSLTVSATVDPDAVVAPTVTPGMCSGGDGVALVVTTGSAGTLITGSVTITVDGNPTVIPIELPATPPNQTVIISACVFPGVGVPEVPAVPEAPELPGVPAVPGTPEVPDVGVPALPNPGGLVAGLVSAVLGLLGGAPALPAPPAI